MSCPETPSSRASAAPQYISHASHASRPSTRCSRLSLTSEGILDGRMISAVLSGLPMVDEKKTSDFHMPGVLHQGYMHAGKGVPEGKRIANRIFEEGPLGASFRRRYFTVLAVEPQDMILPVLRKSTGQGSDEACSRACSSRASRRSRVKFIDTYDAENDSYNDAMGSTYVGDFVYSNNTFLGEGVTPPKRIESSDSVSKEPVRMESIMEVDLDDVDSDTIDLDDLKAEVSVFPSIQVPLPQVLSSADITMKMKDTQSDKVVGIDQQFAKTLSGDIDLDVQDHWKEHRGDIHPRESDPWSPRKQMDAGYVSESFDVGPASSYDSVLLGEVAPEREKACRSDSRFIIEPEFVLCWFADADAFEEFRGSLFRSDHVPDAFRRNFTDDQDNKSVFDSNLCLGNVLVTSCTSIRESIKLDLPGDFYSAIEIETRHRSFLLGVEEEDEFRIWLQLLRGLRQGNLLGPGGADPTSIVGTLFQRVKKILNSKNDQGQTLNKWKQEVGVPVLFHVGAVFLFIWSIGWILCLVFFMNPYLQPCRKGVSKTYVDPDGKCRLLSDNSPYDLCTDWTTNHASLSDVRNWVTQLEMIDFWRSSNVYEGESQICFEKPSWVALFWFWGFTIVETITCYSTIMVVGINWRTVVRGAKLLHEMHPPFPKEFWPMVDVLICHYGEPAEETMSNLMKCLALEYPPSKLHVYICDDGYYKSDFKDVDAGKAYWPQAKRNQGLIANSGDVRQQCADLMKHYLTDGPHQDADQKSHVETIDCLPDPQVKERQVPRIDCAVGYQEDLYELPGVAPVSYVARLKPKVHHSKAGNINNVLYNLDGVGSKGSYTVILDNDMEPHPKFLIACLPIFYQMRQNRQQMGPEKSVWAGDNHYSSEGNSVPSYPSEASQSMHSMQSLVRKRDGNVEKTGSYNVTKPRPDKEVGKIIQTASDKDVNKAPSAIIAIPSEKACVTLPLVRKVLRKSDIETNSSATIKARARSESTPKSARSAMLKTKSEKTMGATLSTAIPREVSFFVEGESQSREIDSTYMNAFKTTALARGSALRRPRGSTDTSDKLSSSGSLPSMVSTKRSMVTKQISKYGCPYTDDPELNTMAFVQTPQYFKKNEVMEVDGDPLSHNNHAFFDSCLHSMDAYNSCMFVGTNVVWRREALDSVGGIQYGTISEDFWTGHMAHWLGWDSAYMRKDRQGRHEDRFRLCEGTAPDSAAASLTQRKRWHKGAVELFVGVKNIRDPSWEPPVSRIPQRPVPKHVTRYREFHWFFARLSWVGSVIPPLFYTILVIGGLWSNTLWIYLNPTPALAIMIPRLWLASFVPTLGDSNVPAEELLSSMPEYFTYAPIRLVGTLEAFQEKCTGKPAKWGNTGGVGRGSRDEIPNVAICFLIFVGLVRSMFTWAFFEEDKEMYELIPIWLFGLIILQTYWRFARVSIQEYLDWPYASLHGRMMFQWFACAGIMTLTVLLMLRADRLS